MREMCYHPHSCHHPHSAGYGRSPHVSVTAQIRTPLSLLVGSCRPQLVSPSALCGIWSLAARVCHRSDPHASVTARGFVSPSARVTIRTLRDMVARRTCLSPLRSARLCHCSWVRVALSSCHHPHSAGYGRSPHVSVTAQIRTPLSLLVGSCRPQLVSPSALCGIWSPIVPAEVTVRPAHVSHVMLRFWCCPHCGLNPIYCSAPPLVMSWWNLITHV